MKYLPSTLMIIMGLVLISIACSGTTIATPESSPIPSTATILPSPTPLPPTERPVPSTSTALPTLEPTLPPKSTNTPVPPAPTVAPIIPTAVPTQPSVIQPTQPQPTIQPTQAPTAAGEGKLTITNEVAFKALISIWGPTEKNLEIEGGKTVVLTLPSGAYGWTIFVNGCKMVAADNMIIKPEGIIKLVSDPGRCGVLVRWSDSH